MKKILIATACACTLCFTSCASKTAPDTNSQTEPQIEAPELQNDETSEADNSEQESEETAEDNVEETGETQNDAESSEDFPEPESLEEPEIITLEPVDLPVPEETEAAPEKVEKEEPPVIAEIETPGQSTEETPETENTENLNPAEETENTDIVISSDSDDDGITAIGGGIDITEEESESEQKYSDIEKDITPSRSVTIKKFEYLDVTYPGTGWIYMGLVDNSKDLAYFGRKLGTKDTKFSLQARTAGTKIVHFYRNDPLTGKYLDDYLEIIILAENGSNKTHIEAPEYKLPVQKKETKKIEVEAEPVAVEADKEIKQPDEKNSKQESSKTVVPAETANTSTTETYQETSEPVTETTTPSQVADSSTLLKEAQVLYNEKEYAAALKKLNQFFEYSTDNRDEALYLKGQILEAKSEVRDIKGSIEAYTSLTKNYPASKLWDSANKRIIYLKRFYLEVR